LNKGRNILICPLEWGLGHAARMIPLARKLQEMNNNIFIGSGEEHLALFRSELQNIECIHFPGFKPGYSRYFPQYMILLLKTPLLLYHIILEHHRLKKIVRDHAIDIVISDNRFGLWHSKVTSAYVTHMPRIPFPGPFRMFEFAGVLLHRAIIRKYSLCFIPDLPGDLNISGRLSHGLKLPDNVRYAGILSRFNSAGESLPDNMFDFQHNTVILSGPEPQREILKQKLVTLLKDQDITTVILEGRPAEMREVERFGNIHFYSHLPAKEMQKMITMSKTIISRSGYTTIMDLIGLNCSALLIPTPGQTEQEYLAAYLAGKGWFKMVTQGRLNSEMSFPSKEASWTSLITDQSKILLTAALKELMEEYHKNDHSNKSCQEP
jgi:hypothetical protein